MFTQQWLSLKNATIKSPVSHNSQERTSAGVNDQITEPDNKSQLQQFFWEKQRRMKTAEDKIYDLICHWQVFMTWHATVDGLLHTMTWRGATSNYWKSTWQMIGQTICLITSSHPAGKSNLLEPVERRAKTSFTPRTAISANLCSYFNNTHTPALIYSNWCLRSRQSLLFPSSHRDHAWSCQ